MPQRRTNLSLTEEQIRERVGQLTYIGLKYCIGIELENEWQKNPGQALGRHEIWDVDGDGSINCAHGGFANELRSRKLMTHEKLINGLLELKQLEDAQDGTFSFPNSTCGTHVHLSRKVGERSTVFPYELTAFDFLQMFMREYQEYFRLEKYLKRFSNTYCRTYDSYAHFLTVSSGQMGVHSDNNSRYHMIQFPRSEHGTMEIRLFPYVQTVRGLIDILTFVDTVIDKWLNSEEYAKYHPRLEHYGKNLVYSLELKHKAVSLMERLLGYHLSVQGNDHAVLKYDNVQIDVHDILNALGVSHIPDASARGF